MNFSPTYLYVVPTSQTAFPTTGSTEDLTLGQLGIFQTDARTVVTAANAAAAKWIQFAQGRPGSELGTDLTPAIKSAKIKDFYKHPGSAAPQVEIWEVSDFHVPKGEAFTLTLRAFSYYLSILSPIGFQRSYTVGPDCFLCSDEACAESDPESIVDALIEKYNQEAALSTGASIPAFFTFTKVGTGDDVVLRITAKPFTEEGQTCDLAADPFIFDRMWFRPFGYTGAETNSDPLYLDDCVAAATTTLIQRSTIATGTSDEIAQMEKDYYSYKVSSFKTLSKDPGYNPYFTSLVEPGTVYDTYYIQFDLDSKFVWNDYVKEDNAIIVAVESGSALSTSLETIMAAFYQAVENKATGTPTLPSPDPTPVP